MGSGTLSRLDSSSTGLREILTLELHRGGSGGGRSPALWELGWGRRSSRTTPRDTVLWGWTPGMVAQDTVLWGQTPHPEHTGSGVWRKETSPGLGRQGIPQNHCAPCPLDGMALHSGQSSPRVVSAPGSLGKTLLFHSLD